MFQLYSFRQVFEDTCDELPSVEIEHLKLALIIARQDATISEVEMGSLRANLSTQEQRRFLIRSFTVLMLV